MQTLRPNDIKTAVIFGGRSWIGYQLAQFLVGQGWRVLCTTGASDLASLNEKYKPIHFVNAFYDSDVNQLIDQYDAAVVVNLTLGITEQDFRLHQSLCLSCEGLSANYVYASSALALDGYPYNERLVDELPPLSISDYGKFKGRCETDLRARHQLPWLAIRFASIHGWSPWKDTRTVGLFKKLQSNQTIQVSEGVVQNRLSDRALVEGIAGLIEAETMGVAHLGATDSSGELDFLARLARRFGYSGGNIVPGEERRVNLAVVPSTKIMKSMDSEQATIDSLFNRDELREYRAIS